MSELIGIDFGTTNSLAAFMDGGRPSLIPNRRGTRSTPSLVALSASGEFLVGESAKNQALANPENTVAAIKRRLGSPEPLRLGGRSFRAEELAALILGSLKADAEAFLGRPVERAVVSAPAHFSDPERRALLEAGRLAGLEIIRILNEPTAAALASSWEAVKAQASLSPEPRLLLVYDFGGGTFDVSLLRQEGRNCSVLASLGDGRLGGMDLDREIFKRAAQAFERDYGLDLEADRLLAQQLNEQAERAKIELSERREASLALPFAIRSERPGAGGGAPIHPVHLLSREDFEALALPYVERSLELTAKALKAAAVSALELDKLVLSGGSSRIPLVRRLLLERFGLKAESGINPEEIVALGAAVAATTLGGEARGAGGQKYSATAGQKAGAVHGEDKRGGFGFRDVVARSYGLEIEGGRFLPIIKKNCPVPTLRMKSFTTVADDQDAVEIHVLQGESELAAENLSLGRFLLAGIRPAKAGKPRISVDFGIDESDILHVSARDLETGASQAISIVDLDRGAADEAPAALVGKIGLLVRRLEELGAAIRLESSLAAELESAAARGRAVSALAGPGELRILKAELEGLVGELLARASSTRLAEAEAER